MGSHCLLQFIDFIPVSYTLTVYMYVPANYYCPALSAFGEKSHPMCRTRTGPGLISVRTLNPAIFRFNLVASWWGEKKYLPREDVELVGGWIPFRTYWTEHGLQRKRRERVAWAKNKGEAILYTPPSRIKSVGNSTRRNLAASIWS